VRNSYGRAEKRLGVAQPALSRQIQNLENEIGFKLFERLPRGVKIAAAGRGACASDGLEFDVPVRVDVAEG